MEPLICSRLLASILLVNRLNGLAVTLSERQYVHLREICEKGTKSLPGWLRGAFVKLDLSGLVSETPSTLILVRDPVAAGFARASFELTEACNYRCMHCYLGDKRRGGLDIGKKMAIIDVIAQSGCLWLQLTGGEPFLDRHFVEIYEYAYAKGLLVEISSNLSLLHETQIIDALIRNRPHRIAVSLYGATESSYESLTRVPGSYSAFCRALTLAKEAGLRIRLNGILTRFNSGELESMKALADGYGFEYHVYPNLSPRLDGSAIPLQFTAGCASSSQHKITADGSHDNPNCMAGRYFFHVDCEGMASICKVARSHQVNVLDEGLEELKRLNCFADVLLKKTQRCSVCDLASQCRTCTPQLLQFQKSGQVPAWVCPYDFREEVSDYES